MVLQAGVLDDMKPAQTGAESNQSSVFRPNIIGMIAILLALVAIILAWWSFHEGFSVREPRPFCSVDGHFAADWYPLARASFLIFGASVGVAATAFSRNGESNNGSGGGRALAIVVGGILGAGGLPRILYNNDGPLILDALFVFVLATSLLVAGITLMSPTKSNGGIVKSYGKVRSLVIGGLVGGGFGLLAWLAFWSFLFDWHFVPGCG